MQQKVKAIGYGCMLVLAAVLLVQAWSLLGEREALAVQEQEVRQELAQAKQFALAHKDYEVYKTPARHSPHHAPLQLRSACHPSSCPLYQHHAASPAPSLAHQHSAFPATF